MAEQVRTVAKPGHEGGAATDYWETLWADEKSVVPGYLLEALAPKLRGARRILESGCGSASYVELLAAADRHVVGVDLAGRALARARRRDRDLDLVEGDIVRLPFPNGAFDAVTSLGVIEHFEHGPGPALREQRRVLAPDGRLVVTVPYRNRLRQVTDTWNFRVRRRATYRQGSRLVHRRPAATLAARGAFHQYEWSARQLRRHLESAGFVVESWEALDVATGLRDLPGRRASARAPSGGVSHDGPGTRPARSMRAWIRGAVLAMPPLSRSQRAIAAASTRALGHIQVVVARPR